MTTTKQNFATSFQDIDTGEVGSDSFTHLIWWWFCTRFIADQDLTKLQPQMQMSQTTRR